MTPHLHPRSRMTSSLFATTVLASFLVVGLPHILPCPAPRVSYADAGGEYEIIVSADGTTRRRRVRRRRREPESKDGGIVQFSSSEEEGDAGRGSEATRERRKECPVPKPGGVIGELMGFKKADREAEGQGVRR
ncbi:hypothetical protein F4810DRAFT_694923 [Camillea tinctor]|nr:hypothetical protein F4810DRAFT_694923 [Camillea tinctor]